MISRVERPLEDDLRFVRAIGSVTSRQHRVGGFKLKESISPYIPRAIDSGALVRNIAQLVGRSNYYLLACINASNCKNLIKSST